MTERETIKVAEPDVPFILGKGGRTKDKLTRVSGARIEVQEFDGKIDLIGTHESIKKCKTYISCLVAQRTGSVELPKEAHTDPDLTLMNVPTECIGAITGPHGSYLRQIEEDNNTLMFFLEGEYCDAEDDGICQLAIFGDRRARRCSQLHALSVVKGICPEYTTPDMAAKVSEDETVRQLSQPQHLKTLLSRKGILKTRIMSAANCFVEIIGTWVAIVGHTPDRKAAENYIGFYINGFTDKSSGFSKTRARSDCLSMQLPVFCLELLTQQVKDQIEVTAKVLLFSFGEPKGYTGVLIFSVSAAARIHAEILIMTCIEKKYPGHYSEHLLDRKTDDPGTETDTFRLQPAELKALTSHSSTINSISFACGGIVELLGSVIHFVGSYDERRRGRLYTKFILEKASKGVVSVPASAVDKDVIVYNVPSAAVKLVTGSDSVIASSFGLAIVSVPTTGTPVVVVCSALDKSRLAVKRTADHHIASLISASRYTAPAKPAAKSTKRKK
eukprot:TRINITY_DN16654_c0_g1_i1.p1 TRINITY_DN16654_c0_g1~~TRINITY_DN16654_c0_g1_i1.p1  ORF type:complete len:501 (+),score=77.10 TRINITY_DN16654_c0_g1_i1:93-1595(+)